MWPPQTSVKSKQISLMMPQSCQQDYFGLRLRLSDGLRPEEWHLKLQRSYVFIMNVTSQEHPEGFSSNFTQMFTLTQRWTNLMLEILCQRSRSIQPHQNHYCVCKTLENFDWSQRSLAWISRCWPFEVKGQGHCDLKSCEHNDSTMLLKVFDKIWESAGFWRSKVNKTLNIVQLQHLGFLDYRPSLHYNLITLTAIQN